VTALKYRALCPQRSAVEARKAEEVEPLQNKRIPCPCTVKKKGAKMLNFYQLPLVEASIWHAVFSWKAHRWGNTDEIRRTINGRSKKARAIERAEAYRETDEPEVTPAWDE